MNPAPLLRAILFLLCALPAAALRAQAPHFDLSALPVYRAEKPIHGVVRLHDTELSQHLVHLWQDAFQKLHPLVRCSEYTVPAWFSGLGADTADLAVAGRRAYPLSRPVYLCFAPATPGGEPADPKVDSKVREFLRYVLSRQGQSDVAREGDYLPLTAEVVQAQRKKLE